MSDEIINWEPQAVADLATTLSGVGNEYRMEIADIYKSFSNIGIEQQWVGKNYNIIANDVLNQAKQSFDGWADYLQIEVPQTIYRIAEAQAEQGGGSVSFSLVPNGAEIQCVPETIAKADGSQIIEPSTVRAIINGPIASACENATIRLQDYYNRFQDLGTLNQNAAILGMYQELESILNKSRSILQYFQEQINNSVESSIQNTEVANEQTIEIANRLASILG